MNKTSFDIFVPQNKKFSLNRDSITAILWFVPLLLLWAFQNKIPKVGTFDDIKTLYFVCITVVTLYYLVSSFWTYKPLKGIMSGKMEIEKEKVIINDIPFELKDITDLDFGFDDHYGQKPIRFYKSVDPMLSQGVDNYITFTDASGLEHLVYFRLQGEHSYLSFSEFINNAVKNKKIMLQRAIELLGIENVSI